MRNKHLIREFVKQGLTRPQAIKEISKSRKRGWENKKIFDLSRWSTPFLKMGRSAKTLSKAILKTTKQFQEFMYCINGFLGELPREAMHDGKLWDIKYNSVDRASGTADVTLIER